jgi:23S rRNA (uracil1939-C5)-methyltransferase
VNGWNADSESDAPPVMSDDRSATALRARVERLVYQGNGLGRLPDGRVFFVPYAAPGDEVAIRVREARGDFVTASLAAVLHPGEGRTEPRCPYFGRCGGCQWQHLDHETQVRWKQRVLEELLRRVGKLEGLPVSAPLTPLRPWEYRARAQLKVAGRAAVGFCERETNRVVDVAACPLLDGRLNAVLRVLRAMRTPHLAALFPGLREIWLAAGTGTEDVLVSLFARPRERGASRLLLHTLQEAVPGVRGVVLLAGEPRENPTLADWHGQPSLVEQVGPYRFRVGPTAFFQVNGLAAGSLTALVEEFAGLTGSERVLDVHCGVGTFTVPLAHRAAEVVGIEAGEAAAKDAEQNLAANACPGARVVHGRAEQLVPALTSEGRWDVVVLDPPRSGCSRSLLDALGRHAPRRIVYVSCDPSTLARDLAVLTRSGFVCRRLQPVDLFPQTYHLETVALLEHLGSACAAGPNPG